ncbi:MAG: hypothetical protein ABFD50_22285 [Smithella sp.]
MALGLDQVVAVPVDDFGLDYLVGVAGLLGDYHGYCHDLDHDDLYHDAYDDLYHGAHLAVLPAVDHHDQAFDTLDLATDNDCPEHLLTKNSP